MNIAWWVQRWSNIHPDKPAVIFEDRTITYQDLHRRAEMASCWFQHLGIEKGDRVAVMMTNGPEFLEIFLACSRLGAILVPVNFRLTQPELDYTLKNSSPRLFVFSEKYMDPVLALNPKDELPRLTLSIHRANQYPAGEDNGFTDYHEAVAAFEGKTPHLTPSTGPADPGEAHVIMYTSGTTGQPKGAVLPHRKTFFNCLNADIFYKMDYDDIMLVVTPLFHSGALLIQTAPTLYKGATLVIHPKFDPKRTYEDIARYRVTKFLGVPTIYRALLRVPPAERRDISSLRVSAIGGEKVTVDLLIECGKAGFPLRQVMGQTETSIMLWASEEDFMKKPGTLGKPVFHAEIDILDKQGRRVPVDSVGEVVVKGPITMKEYWHDPAKTEETMRNGWHHTGDLAKKDEDGYFYLMDRAKDMYISGGENVYPAEVEKVLRKHPGLEDVAVAGMADSLWGETGVAFIIPKSGNKLDPKELLTLCDGKLARYKWPKKYVFCEEFPRTVLGKVQKPILVQTNKGKEQPIEKEGNAQ
ncbi:class I adenylate-forming enzyme family protein [Desulfosarcina ovata]|uniref:class I adenylate-forming enzyme family protein n=1 Tax=Desulfosarcina ovata TaxID=83564 RepID=UPI0012D31075|nr:AMP-binding protein [Desulfosarcina ovata]